jgi:hypothetical protein
VWLLFHGQLCIINAVSETARISKRKASQGTKPLTSLFAKQDNSDAPAAKKQKTAANDDSEEKAAKVDKPAKSEARFALKPEWVQHHPFIYTLEEPDQRGLEVCVDAKNGGTWDTELHRSGRLRLIETTSAPRLEATLALKRVAAGASAAALGIQLAGLAAA